MRDLWKNENRPDNEVIFYDGFLYIICRDAEPYVDGCELTPAQYSVKSIILNAEYDAPWSLADIVQWYPNVCKVIYDDALRGTVYSYGNHAHDKSGNVEMWEKVGETVGYA